MALEKINKQKSMGNLSKSIKERIRVDRSVKTKLK